MGDVNKLFYSRASLKHLPVAHFLGPLQLPLHIKNKIDTSGKLLILAAQLSENIIVKWRHFTAYFFRLLLQKNGNVALENRTE